MPRYKTSDGRVLTLCEVYGNSTRIELSNIKYIGAELFPYPIKLVNNGAYYTYNFTQDNAINFSLVGQNGSFPLDITFNNGTNLKYCLGGSGGSEIEIRNDASFSYGAYSSGIYPLSMIAVKANEKSGSYTDVYIIQIHYDKYENVNYYTKSLISSYSKNLLLNFLNGNNDLSEPDSSPVADENGFFDSGSDAITLPNIDTINVASALQSSGVKAHKVDITEINKFFGTLWSTDFFDTIIKNQQAPIDNILSLSTYPYDVQDNGTNEEIKVGTVSMGATGKLITAQFQEIDFGEIDCKEYYGNSLDYTYTDVDIYLPFIGTKALDVNIIGGAVVSLVYRVDILTGNCDAIISAKRNRDGTVLNSVLYIFSGNLQNQIPLTQQQNQTLLKLESAIQTTIQGAVMGNPKGGVAGGVAGLAAEGMTMALTGQPTTRYQMSGNLSTANGYMGVLTPYLIWYRPVNVKPSGYDKYYGYPSFFTRTLSDCSGYTKVHELISDAPTGVPADDWEKIKQMLKDGVIIN